MAPKGKKDKSKDDKGDNSDDISNNLNLLAENLCGNQSLAKQQLTLTRGEAAYYVWRHAISSEGKRQEIAKKFTCIPYLLQLVGGGDTFSQHVAIGCLQFLAHSEDLRELIITRGYGDKSLGNVVKLLEGDHDRTKVRSAALLYQVCQVPEIAVLMRDYLPAIISCLEPTESQWAGSEDTRAFAAGILRSFSHCDFSPELVNLLPEGTNVRAQLLEEGALPPILNLMITGNPMAQTEAVSLLAVLCEEEGVPAEILESGGLDTLVELITSGQDEAKAHAAGVIKLIAVEPDYMEQVAACGVIPPLVFLLTPPQKSEGATSKKGKAKPKKKKGAALPPVVDLAIQNAAGALHHLSFLESTIRLMVEARAIHPLVGLLESRNLETFRHATGVLYNIALDPDNYQELVDCRAPAYLTRPLHNRWLISKKMQEQQHSAWTQEDYELGAPYEIVQ